MTLLPWFCANACVLVEALIGWNACKPCHPLRKVFIKCKSISLFYGHNHHNKSQAISQAISHGSGNNVEVSTPTQMKQTLKGKACIKSIDLRCTATDCKCMIWLCLIAIVCLGVQRCDVTFHV
eukprot:scaffold400210_cov20-Prasinocladus_malaysianus.AAC.1